MRESLFIWQSLLAGGLGLLGGVIAFAGALLAANCQVKGMRRAADQEVAAVREAAEKQVAAVQAQIDDLQAARREIELRRLSVLEWAVRGEGRRLETAAALMREALPSAPGWASRDKDQLVIESSSLLRAEREDMALLDDETRALLEEVAGVLDEYNTRIETAKLGTEGPLIVQKVLDLRRRLGELAAELRET
jgi:hypothetical protein